MNQLSKRILILAMVVFGCGLSLINSVYAQSDLDVEFQNEPPLPLFNNANILPGDSVTRWVKVINNSAETQPIITEAINYPSFPNFSNVPNDDLSRILLIIIREKGDNDLYGGSTGIKTLFNFYENGETYLSDIASNNLKEYEFEITFPLEKESEWQEKGTSFDILVGFQGNGGEQEETDGDSGGGGSLPPGLTIFNEAEEEVDENWVTISWSTNYQSTSYVIYGTINEAHVLNMNDNAGSPPKYGYAHTTPEKDTSPKVFNHEVTITGLTPGTVYYYRCVSHASLAVSELHSFTTLKENGEKAITEEELPLEEKEIAEKIKELFSEIGEKTKEITGIKDVIAKIEKSLTGESKDSEQEELFNKNLGLLANIGMIWSGIGSSNLILILLLIILILILIKWYRDRANKKEKKDYL